MRRLLWEQHESQDSQAVFFLPRRLEPCPRKAKRFDGAFYENSWVTNNPATFPRRTGRASVDVGHRTWFFLIGLSVDH
ncbi:hypothetical protein [Alteribacillus sp. HJP-4]|uniref:hypothetical protein n=1 Tax=Alteribacillus sp. HJP-4 TaxID=2775394 RepID=UPI0035CD3948